MFESDKIPDDWVDYCKAADLVLVPSKWCQQVFKKSGINTQVLPLGYNDQVFLYKERIIKRDYRQDFVFLHYNAFNLRKGFPEVFKAFVKAFRQDEPVKMIFKTTLQQMPIPITKKQYPNIEVVLGAVGESEIANFCNNADCFVFPSRGEGFGITPLEAMATGMPAIVPNAHGISEYFNPEYMYEVKVKETCPGLYSRYKGQDVGHMVICDVDDLAQKMRWVYEHQQEAAMMGKKASEYVKQWTIRKTAEGLKSIIDKVQKLPLNDKPINNALELEVVK
jgi:glycosyltransferase involved in cell wall biosynthesis